MAVLSAGILLVGCSTAYRSGQTPDDVYFSPARNNNSGYVVVDDEMEMETTMQRTFPCKTGT